MNKHDQGGLNIWDAWRKDMIERSKTEKQQEEELNKIEKSRDRLLFLLAIVGAILISGILWEGLSGR